MFDISEEAVKKTHNPCKLTFKNLNYHVELGKNTVNQITPSTNSLHIIKNVSGYAVPGQTLFIMGASGAGKTTLLNILSDRVQKENGAKLTGKMMINDTLVYDDSNFGLISGYVMQDDVLYQHFTPREALKFAAELKLANVSQEEKE